MFHVSHPNSCPKGENILYNPTPKNNPKQTLIIRNKLRPRLKTRHPTTSHDEKSWNQSTRVGFVALRPLRQSTRTAHLLPGDIGRGLLPGIWQATKLSGLDRLPPAYDLNLELNSARSMNMFQASKLGPFSQPGNRFLWQVCGPASKEAGGCLPPLPSQPHQPAHITKRKNGFRTRRFGFKVDGMRSMILHPFLDHGLYQAIWDMCGLKGFTQPNEREKPWVLESSHFDDFVSDSDRSVSKTSSDTGLSAAVTQNLRRLRPAARNTTKESYGSPKPSRLKKCFLHAIKN